MDLNELLELVATNQTALKQFMAASAASAPRVGYRHDLGGSFTGALDEPNYIHEDAFFQQCELDNSILNFTIHPTETLLNYIPARPAFTTDVAYGSLTAWDETLTGDRPADVCAPGQVVGYSWEACKLHFPWSRLPLHSKTLELDQLIRKACDGERDSFYFVGSVRGVQAPPMRRLDSMRDRDLITSAAVMRIFFVMSKIFMSNLARQIWVGDPVNNTTPTTPGNPAGYREFLGLTHLVDDDIPNSVALAQYLESSSGNLADCAAMNSDVKVFDSCVSGNNVDGYNIWQLMVELEDTLWRRARAMSLLPVDWRWVMNPLTWSELVKVLPCERTAEGCINMGEPITGGGGTRTANIDLGAMLRERDRMESSMSLTINGRTRPVLLDDFMPATIQNTTELVSDIWLLPWSASGEELLWYEWMDYRRILRYLSPIPNGQVEGWTDQGMFHAVISQILRCFDIDVKTEGRLIFRGSPLAGRITGVRACPAQVKPQHQFVEALNQ